MNKILILLFSILTCTTCFGQTKYDFSKTIHKSFIDSIISPNDSNIEINSLYHCFIDESRKMFVAFFIEKSTIQDFKTFKDNNQDNTINIISNKDIHDPNFLADVPQIYAYIVAGVNYQNKWYYQKEYKTYFGAKDLEEGKQEYFKILQENLNFFKNNSIEINSDFWETGIFSKIESAVEKNKKEIEQVKQMINQSKKQEEKDIYQNIIDEYYNKDLQNKEYFGLYKIVADEMKNEKEKLYNNLDSIFSNNILIPFYDLQIQNNPTDFSEYSILDEKLTLIYPKERNIILNPIMITNAKGEKSLRFFLAFTETKKIYEWTYFKPKKNPQKSWQYGIDIFDQMKTIVKWDFSFTTLDDKNFWDNYVLAMIGGAYKYLKDVK